MDRNRAQAGALSSGLTRLMAAASGLAVADIYYNQPMLADMARTFHATAGALAAAASARNLPWLIAASFLIGLTSVNAQILIPLATELASPAEQGRTIGAILSGVLLGILLARTVSGFVAGYFGWRTMFWAGAVIVLATSAAIRAKLPRVPARQGTNYRELMRSIWNIFLEIPKLRQVSLVAGLFFASFSAFWTTLVFHLEALIFVIAGTHLWGLVIGVVVLDAGIQAAQVANQTRVLTLRPEARSRVNTVYMICYFGGGSAGSVIGNWAWSRWQWAGVCGAGMALMLLAAAGLLSRGPMPDAARQTG